MKKYLFALLVCVMAFAAPATAQNVEFEKIVENNISKGNLCSNAQKWGSTNDPMCERNIDVLNFETGNLIISVEVRNKKRESSDTKYLTYKFKFSVNIDCKDNKYRYIISSPSVLVGADNNINISHLSTKQLFEYRDELEAVARISEKEFNKILDWKLDDISNLIALNNEAIKQYNEQIIDLEGNKKNKKEIQRIKYRQEDIIANNLILNESLKRWEIIVSELSADIEKAMNVNDDF